MGPNNTTTSATMEPSSTTAMATAHSCPLSSAWWSCSFENMFYTGCCSANACHQTPVGCPDGATTSTVTVTRISTAPMYTAPPTLVVTIEPIEPTGSKLKADSDHEHDGSSLRMPGLAVVAVIAGLFGALGLYLLWQACSRRRQRKKSAGAPEAPSKGPDQTNDDMGEHFNMPVNPEAFPFSAAHVGGGHPGAGEVNGKSVDTSFDGTDVTYNRYTNASPTLGELDDGNPMRSTRGASISPGLDGAMYGAEAGASPRFATNGRFLTPSSADKRDKRLGPGFGTPTHANAHSWATYEDIQLKDEKKL